MTDLWDLDDTDLKILLLIASQGKATRYDIAPHGKTRRKQPIKDLAPSSTRARLQRLELNGYVLSEKEMTGLRRRFYSPTLTGFLCLIARNQFAASRKLLEAVDACGIRIKARSLEHKRLRTSKKGKPLMPIVISKPILPLRYSKELRRDLGDANYVKCLSFAANIAHLNILTMKSSESYSLQDPKIRLPRLKMEDGQSLYEYISFYKEDDLAHKFEVAFIGSVFWAFQYDLRKVISSRFPHDMLYKEAKALLESEIQNTVNEKKRLQTILERSLNHFGREPDSASTDPSLLISFPDD